MSKLGILAPLCLVSLCSAGTVAHAQILSNLPGTSSGTGSNLGLGIDAVDRTKAVGLTTGPDARNFASVELLVSNTSPDSVLSGGIFSDVGGNPGVLLAAFTPLPVLSNTTSTIVTLTTAAPFVLQPATTYWFVMDGPATTNSLLWESLNPNVAPAPSGPGITFAGYRFSSNGGGTWGNSTIFNGVRVNALVVPVELQTFTIE